MTEPDVPFSIEYRVGLELDRSKFREACRKINDRADCMERVRAITLLAPGEAEICCKCGATRIARSRPPGKSGQLGGALNQYWKEHLKTCSYGSSSDEHAKDEDGNSLFYAREFPLDAAELAKYFEDDWFSGDYILTDILKGKIPIRAKSISAHNIQEIIRANVLERSRRRDEALELLIEEVDKQLPHVPEAQKVYHGHNWLRPRPADIKEDERVQMEALFSAFDMAMHVNPTSIMVLLEHALCAECVLDLICIVGVLRINYMLSDAFPDALHARLKKHMKELRKRIKA